MKLAAKPTESREKREERARELIGRVLGERYRLDSVIGIGMMGAVFGARHLGLARDVAIKLLHRELLTDPDMVERFKVEASAISRLDHPNCVRVLDFGEEATLGFFIVMERLVGRELSRVIDGPMPVERALTLVDHVLDGLQHAHDQGVIHRDIKPENIFVVNEGEHTESVKILDFGIAKVQAGAGSEMLTQRGIIFGTPSYMSPEQASGKALDHRSDLYSVGVLLYDLLAGRAPFDEPDPIRVLRKHLTQTPPPLPDHIPHGVKATIFKLLAKDPVDRPASAADARVDLQQAQEVDASAATVHRTRRVTVRVPAIQELPWRSMAVLGAVGFLFVVAIVLARTRADPNRSTASAQTPTLTNRGALTAPERAEPSPGLILPTERAPGELSVSLASVDALIEAKKYEAARISLGPLLTAYPQDPSLHFRMGTVLSRLPGRGDLSAALASYSNALAFDPSLRDNPTFMAELEPLLDDEFLRPEAVELALQRLQEHGLDRLASWLNLQKDPLPYSTRHRIIEHLTAANRGRAINRPLQIALDLWQASDTEDPCTAFDTALVAAESEADTFLLGTLERVPVPILPGSHPPEECPGRRVNLDRVRALYDEMFLGIEPVVPSAYRRGRR